MPFKTREEQEKEKQPKKPEVHEPIPETGFRVFLTNDDGAGYTGTILVGSEEKPVKVLFDTGSDFLAVTSSLCNDQSLGQKELDEPVFDPVNFAYMPSGKDHRKCKSIGYNLIESKTA